MADVPHELVAARPDHPQCRDIDINNYVGFGIDNNNASLNGIQNSLQTLLNFRGDFQSACSVPMPCL